MIPRISSSYLGMARGRVRSPQVRSEHDAEARLGTITRSLVRGRVIPLILRKLLLKILLLLLLLAVLPELACFGLPGPLSRLVTSKVRRC